MRLQILMMCILLSGCQQRQDILQTLIQAGPVQDAADVPLTVAPAQDAPSHARARARAVLFKTNPPARISESERRFLRDAGTYCHDPHVRQRLEKDVKAEGGAFATGGLVPFQEDVLDVVSEAQRIQGKAHVGRGTAE